MLAGVALLVAVLWVWMVHSAWRISRTWGLITLLAWPIAALLLLSEDHRKLRLPYLVLLVATLVLGKLWFDRPLPVATNEVPTTQVAGAINRTEQIPAESASTDDVPARVQWRRTIDGLSFRHGDIELRPAKASLLLPESFRFIGRASTERVLGVLERPPSAGLLGWVIHESIDLAKDDAWSIEVSWHNDGFLPLRSLAEMAPERLWILTQYTHAEVAEYRERQGYERAEMAEFVVEPRPENDLVYWATKRRHADGRESLQCQALRRGRYGWLEFVSRNLPTEQLELCLRSVRAIAASSRFDHGAAVRDTVRSDPRSDLTLVDIISGRRTLKRLEGGVE